MSERCLCFWPPLEKSFLRFGVVFELCFSSEIGHAFRAFRALSCAFARDFVLAGGSKDECVFGSSLLEFEKITKTVRVGCVQW